MADKKLSEFSQITPDEISKLICLYLDQNNAIKNGVVDFATLNNLLMHKDGTETISGDKTFSGDTVFSGDATFNNKINGNMSGHADLDAQLSADNTFTGNNTFAGYITKTGAFSYNPIIGITVNDTNSKGYIQTHAYYADSNIYNRILAIKKKIAIFSNMDKPSVYPEWS